MERKKVAFVQLCRSGDLVLCLPMMLAKWREGCEVFCVVHRDFADILQAVSYVTPIVFDGPHRDVAGAVALSKKHGIEEIIVTQAPPIKCDMVSGLVKNAETNAIIESKTFTERLWRAGWMWDQFHNLPLVFDFTPWHPRCDLRLGRDKPTLTISLQGYSSYFKDSAILQGWIASEFAEEWLVNDITYDPVLNRGKKLDSVLDLIPMIATSDVLITTNSLPLHIAYAYSTPTIALQPNGSPDDLEGDPTYWKAIPRPHWIGELSYRESITSEGKQKITSILDGCRNGRAATAGN